MTPKRLPSIYYRLPTGGMHYITMEGLVLRHDKVAKRYLVKSYFHDVKRWVPMCNVIPKDRISIETGMEFDPGSSALHYGPGVGQRICEPCEDYNGE